MSGSGLSDIDTVCKLVRSLSQVISLPFSFLRHCLHHQIYCTGSSGCGEHLGVACTESHLLLLGTRRAVTASDDSRRTDAATSRHDQGQLKLLLRIRKRYKKAVVSKSFAFLVCDDAGTLDVFQVVYFHSSFLDTCTCIELFLSVCLLGSVVMNEYTLVEINVCSILMLQLTTDATHGVVGQFFTTIEAHGQEITKILPTADGV